MQYDEPMPSTREVRIELELASWIYQSHLWKKGGFADDNILCEWCGQRLMGVTNITIEGSLCSMNPKIKEMRLGWEKNLIRGTYAAKKLIAESRGEKWERE